MSELRVWTWRAAILKSQLPSGTRFLLLTMTTYMNDFGESCFPSQEELAQAMDKSREFVNRQIMIAVDAGWLQVRKHGYGGQKWARNEYVALWPENAPKQGAEAEKGSDRGSQPSEEKDVTFCGEGSDIEGQKVVIEDHTNSSENSPRISPERAGARGREGADALEGEGKGPFGTPSAPQGEEGALEEGGEHPENAKRIERDFKRAIARWPTQVSDSHPAAWAAFEKLDPASRFKAAERQDDYVAANAAAGRKQLCSHGVYLSERRWENLPPPSQAQVSAAPQTVHAPAFGPLWQALRFALLSEGALPLPPLRAFEAAFVADNPDSDAAARIMDKHALEKGWPKIAALHSRAKTGEGRLLPKPLADGLNAAAADMEPVPVDSAMFEAWKAHHAAKGWPWLPDAGRMEVVYFPKGGPSDPPSP